MGVFGQVQSLRRTGYGLTKPVVLSWRKFVTFTFHTRVSYIFFSSITNLFYYRHYDNFLLKTEMAPCLKHREYPRNIKGQNKQLEIE